MRPQVAKARALVYLSGNARQRNPASQAPGGAGERQGIGTTLLRYAAHSPLSAWRALARLFFALALAVAALGCPVARAADGALDLGNLTLDNHAGDITVRFGVSLPDIEGLEQELAAGTTVGLKCQATIYRRKSLWADTNVAEATLVSPLRKDALANDYILEIPGDPRPLRDKNLAALLDKGWGRLAMDLGPWESLLPGHQYRLRLEISMGRLEVPVWMRYVVFFMSFDLYKPVSYQLEFNY